MHVYTFEIDIHLTNTYKLYAENIGKTDTDLSLPGAHWGTRLDRWLEGSKGLTRKDTTEGDGIGSTGGGQDVCVGGWGGHNIVDDIIERL